MCHLHHKIHLWHGLWSVRESILGLWVISAISAELLFCWKTWLAACCPPCRCCSFQVKRLCHEVYLNLFPAGAVKELPLSSCKHAEQEHLRDSSPVMSMWVRVQQNWPVWQNPVMAINNLYFKLWLTYEVSVQSTVEKTSTLETIKENVELLKGSLK